MRFKLVLLTLLKAHQQRTQKRLRVAEGSRKVEVAESFIQRKMKPFAPYKNK